jgi:hypothetical protein
VFARSPEIRVIRRWSRKLSENLTTIQQLLFSSSSCLLLLLLLSFFLSFFFLSFFLSFELLTRCFSCFSSVAQSASSTSISPPSGANLLNFEANRLSAQSGCMSTHAHTRATHAHTAFLQTHLLQHKHAHLRGTVYSLPIYMLLNATRSASAVAQYSLPVCLFYGADRSCTLTASTFHFLCSSKRPSRRWSQSLELYFHRQRRPRAA